MIPSTTAATILVVDANEAICDLLEVILVRAGYRVHTASNGAEALRLARGIPQVDLLVSDIEMPAMRGDELAARFSRIHPSALVMFVSSSDRPALKQQPAAFLPKPFTIACLRDTVRSLLATRPRSAETARAA